MSELGLTENTVAVQAFPAPAACPLWYALHVRSNSEKRVATDLAAKGVENYLPTVPEWRAWKDRKKLVQWPVFPGYVFARFADGPDVRLHVVRTAGVVRILGSNNSIEPVPDVEIDAIQRLLGANVALATHPLLREGSRVRIRRGPLRDLVGLLVRFRGQARLVLSVELLSRSVSTEVDVSDVEPVPEPHDGAFAWG